MKLKKILALLFLGLVATQTAEVFAGRGGFRGGGWGRGGYARGGWSGGGWGRGYGYRRGGWYGGWGPGIGIGIDLGPRYGGYYDGYYNEPQVVYETQPVVVERTVETQPRRIPRAVTTTEAQQIAAQDDNADDEIMNNTGVNAS